MLKIGPRIRTNYIVLIRNVSNYSTQPVIKEIEGSSQDEQITEYQRISNIQQKFRQKKPQKPPFAKNLLLGNFDSDILTYPELKNEELDNLNRTLRQAQTLLTQPEIRECSVVSKSFLKKLASGKLLALQASQLMGGLELGCTDICRISEAIAEINLKNCLINNENLAVQTLVKFGSDYLKRKYLQKLIDGESVAAFCTIEPVQQGQFTKKTAVKSSDGKTWTLNGEKKVLLNGSSADFYIIVASSDYLVREQTREQKFTIFLVERDFGGITTSKHKSLDGTELSSISFENTPVPAENVIGKDHEGADVLSKIYPEHHLSTGPICVTIMRQLINNITEHYIKSSTESQPLFETDAIRIVLAKLATSLYAVESVVYLTSGLIDNYENQDTELETSIVKVFASEQASKATSACLNLIGQDVLINDHWCAKLHQEAVSQTALNDDNDNLKILNALFGLRFAGQEINEIVKKMRNPFFHLAFLCKQMWMNRRQDNDNPELNLNLHFYLHPSCLGPSKKLEYCVLRLQYATQRILTRHGPEILERHEDLRRLADIIADIYVMTACLSRASRSYCIGLQHADYEMKLALAFVQDATNRVKKNVEELIGEYHVANDDNHRNIAKRLFKFKTYFPVHPLTRNF